MDSRAAQSARSDHEYAWGTTWRNDAANTSEWINHTTAVGMYPQGNSLQGVSDLAGNVWEWCSNKYSAKGGSRVLRGGSWSSFRDFARADYRLRNGPEGRNFNLGFRVVCSSPIIC